ncbi:MAG: hypothetical protein LBR35_01935 [Rickettsiales bacterium]|jgi:hypothetical protein|nr:hypothetical protein [Rickettsiales bacterium]
MTNLERLFEAGPFYLALAQIPTENFNELVKDKEKLEFFINPLKMPNPLKEEFFDYVFKFRVRINDEGYNIYSYKYLDIDIDLGS